MIMKTLEYDIAVVGGGFAGISAALSAAREKKNAVLIESLFSLGGLATNGLISFYLPICDGRARQLMYSIPYELFLLSLSEGYEEKYPSHWLDYDGTYEEKINGRLECKFNPQLFSLLVEKLLIENGVHIIYGATLSSVSLKNDLLKSIKVTTRTETIEIKANAFVDCTGDASLNNLCSVEIVETPITNKPAYWYYVTDKEGNKLINKGSTDLLSFDEGNGVGTKGLDSEEVSNYMIDYHQFVLKDFLFKGKEKAFHSLTTLSNIPELRMTRKIKSKQDVRYEDDHKYQKTSIGLFGDWTRPGPIWELPIGSLLNNKVKNLSTAGRCIGVDNLQMWNIARVIPVCALSGEACGVIASLINEQGDFSIEKVQEILLTRKVPLHI